MTGQPVTTFQVLILIMFVFCDEKSKLFFPELYFLLNKLQDSVSVVCAVCVYTGVCVCVCVCIFVCVCMHLFVLMHMYAKVLTTWQFIIDSSISTIYKINQKKKKSVYYQLQFKQFHYMKF